MGQKIPVAGPPLPRGRYLVKNQRITTQEVNDASAEHGFRVKEFGPAAPFLIDGEYIPIIIGD